MPAPAARGPRITVRAAEPVEVLMVTVAESVALQLNLTLCLFVIVLVFTEKIRVGGLNCCARDCRQHHGMRKGIKRHQ